MYPPKVNLIVVNRQPSSTTSQCLSFSEPRQFTLGAKTGGHYPTHPSPCPSRVNPITPNTQHQKTTLCRLFDIPVFFVRTVCVFVCPWTKPNRWFNWTAQWDGFLFTHTHAPLSTYAHTANKLWISKDCTTLSWMIIFDPKRSRRRNDSCKTQLYYLLRGEGKGKKKFEASELCSRVSLLSINSLSHYPALSLSYLPYPLRHTWHAW